MAIIKQTDLLFLDGNPMQDLGENPTRTYRELLMEIPSAQSGLDPTTYGVNYQVAVAANTLNIVRIPHGLTSLAANPIVPDVVIPVRCHVVGAARARLDVMTIIDPTLAISASGWTADGTYVYLALANHELQSHGVTFVVYIEYTHSIITSEFYTGTADILA